MGELLILVVMLGSLLKFKGMVSIQAKGDGAIGFLTADYTDAGHLRAYAHLRDKKLLQKTRIKTSGNQDIAKLLGKGFLVITIEPEARNPYQAIVPLEGKTLSDCVTSYFTQSDQLDVAVKVAVNKKNKQWHACGILLQRIPQEGGKNGKNVTNQESWNNAKIMLASVTDAELIDNKLPLTTLLYNLFHEIGVRIFDMQKLKAKCRCTKKRMLNAIKTLSPEQINDMKINDGITMTCRFCNNNYFFKC